MRTAVVAGSDSGIADILSTHLTSIGWRVVGTTRRSNVFSKNPALIEKSVPDKKYFCDFSSQKSIDDCTEKISEEIPDWELLILSIGQLSPIGKILDVNSDLWEESFYINFLGQFRFIKKLLASSKIGSNKMVVTFAGSGTNSAPLNYSSYTLAKISLIKAMELFAAENPEINFVSLGTGWMDTPIHEQTLLAGNLAGDNLEITKKKIANSEFGDPRLLTDFLDWCLEEKMQVLSGRNFSLQGDDWNESNFKSKLKQDPNLFKLRRLS